MDTLEVERANESGGSGSSRQYARVGKGSENGGQFASTNTAGSSSARAPLTPGGTYKPRAKKGGGGSSQPGLPASSKFKTLGPGEDNDPQSVAEMQQLLTALGLGNLEANGQFDGNTAQAVMEAQKRLGMKPTGKANKGLVNKLLNAYDLSPCVKRAEDLFDDDDIERRRPYPGQKYKHGWIPVTVTSAEGASGRSAEQQRRVREMEQHIEKLRRDGPPQAEVDPDRYVTAETRYWPNGTVRNPGYEIGERIPFPAERLGYEKLPTGHYRNPADGRLYGQYGHPYGWSDDLAAAEEYLTNLKDPAWWSEHGDEAIAAIEALKRQARDLRMRRQRARRSEDPDPSDLIRSDPLCEFTVSRSEDLMFDTLRSAVAEPDEDDVTRAEEYEPRAYTNPREPEHTPGHAACCPDVYEDEAHVFRREFELDGIEIIRGGQGGDGRTVEAYATVFDSPTEVKDQHGHYMETIDRAAFNEVLRGGYSRVKVFYNHGMDLHGRPSDMWSVPIGTPVDIRADGKGLRTITRFNEGADGDRVLEAIRNQAITGYSFRGPIRGSEPRRIPRARDGMPLPEVRRTRLGLTEYGPTPMPYYAGAGIVALRSRLSTLDPAEVREILQDLFRTSPPQDQDALRTALTAPPAPGPGAEDQPIEALRSALTMADVRREIRSARILKGIPE